MRGRRQIKSLCVSINAREFGNMHMAPKAPKIVNAREIILPIWISPSLHSLKGTNHGSRD
jgi:hypothetical protein